jgi:DNA-binding response OmpR family regulator
LEDGISEFNKDNFDLILLDLALPDSFGINTFYKMQTLAKGVPIAVLTGYQDEDYAIMAVRNGAIDYISKNNLNTGILRRF